MSWKVQAIVGERVCGSITRKMVLLNMASRANDDGTGVYASLTMIAGWCEVDARTVRRVVRELEDQGLIRQVGWRTVKHGKINEWEVNSAAIEALPLYRDEVAAKREAKASKTPDTVSGVVKTTRKIKPKAPVTARKNPGHSVTPDTGPPRTQNPATPDTESASSILEPIQVEVSSETKVPEDTMSGSLLVELPERDDVTAALAEYNAAASRRNWIGTKGKLNPTRRQAIRARLRDNGGLSGWREQLLLAEQTPFLGGASKTGWRMDFDFFTSLRGWTAIAEGKYQRTATPDTVNRKPAGYGPDGKPYYNRKRTYYT